MASQCLLFQWNGMFAFSKMRKTVRKIFSIGAYCTFYKIFMRLCWFLCISGGFVSVPFNWYYTSENECLWKHGKWNVRNLRLICKEFPWEISLDKSFRELLIGIRKTRFKYEKIWFSNSIYISNQTTFKTMYQINLED